MLTIEALKDALQEQMDKAEAIVALASKEQRELTADESAEYDGIVGSGDPKSKEFKPGKVQDLQAKLARAEQLETLRKEIAAKRFAQSPPIDTTVETPAGVVNYQRIVLPAKAKRSGFKAFTGPDAAKDAYIAGNFYAAALGNNEHSKKWLSDHGMGIQAAMSGSTNSAGGYLVPEVLEGAMVRLVEEYGVALKECRVVPMSSDNVSFPRRAGGFTSYWLGQNTAITASDMSFDQVRLEAKKLCVLTQLSSELGEDAAYALGDIFTSELAYQVSYDLDNALFNGDGTSTYGQILGLKNALAAGAIQTDGANDDTFAEVVIGEFEAAQGLIKQYPGLNPKWYCHSSGFFNVMQRLALAAGGSTVENYQRGMGPSFLGYPVVFSQVLSSGVPTTDLSSTIWAFYGDLAQAVTIGMKRGITVANSEHYGFNSDSLYVRCTMRCDINVHERGTASAAGPIVALKMGS